MADWAPVLIGVVLFVLLSPGLLFSFPGNSKQLEFGSMKTNGKAIAIHTLLFFAIYAVLIPSTHGHSIAILGRPEACYCQDNVVPKETKEEGVGRLGASSGGSGAVCVVFTRVAVSAAWKQKSSGIC
ncbi:hypothetical protein Godav_002597 [Gossypium davidsonii]|uniref:Transmembrane protein n=2 Tax=Gossypium TaxID=3633 RepID=A0A7J8SYB4_GOSDV|nr:hypothetical protein [Gossypium davidsonii]MBA0666219.1 hypothetical protein [Gossypium klotzschianum]